MHSFVSQVVCGAVLLGGAAFAAVAATVGPVTSTAPVISRVDIDARVSYETRQVMSSGVTRTDRWQEHLVRRGNQVWTERIRPAATHAGQAHETVPEHAGHRHLNAETSARWLTLKPDGQVEMKFVDRENKVVVSVPRAEFGTVGFDGRFDAAASIVPPAVAHTMAHPMARQAGRSTESRWLTDRGQGWSHQVLWSASKQLAMRVESRRDDGSVQRIVSVQLLPAAPGKPVPWSQLTDYTPKQYDDFMD